MKGARSPETPRQRLGWAAERRPWRRRPRPLSPLGDSASGQGPTGTGMLTSAFAESTRARRPAVAAYAGPDDGRPFAVDLESPAVAGRPSQAQVGGRPSANGTVRADRRHMLDSTYGDNAIVAGRCDRRCGVRSLPPTRTSRPTGDAGTCVVHPPGGERSAPQPCRTECVPNAPTRWRSTRPERARLVGSRSAHAC
jgi:hypothetical protein